MSFADHQSGTNNDCDVDQVRRNLQEIARTEITRHRRRLGSLTSEQHSAIEALLISTADQISAELMQRLQKYPSDLRAEYLNVWNPRLAA